MDILFVVDVLAGKWLDYRTRVLAKRSGMLTEDVKIKEVKIDKDYYRIIAEHPMVPLMADLFSSFLTDTGAKNYFEFELLPRIDRRLAPIRVTIQWVDGMSPAQKATRLLAALESVRDDMALLVREKHIESYNFEHIDAAIAQAKGEE